MIVDATSVEMRQNDVCDAAYSVGRETGLIRRSREAGTRAVSGGWMLPYQGLQRIRMGREPDVEVMSRALA